MQPFFFYSKPARAELVSASANIQFNYVWKSIQKTLKWIQGDDDNQLRFN